MKRCHWLLLTYLVVLSCTGPRFSTVTVFSNRSADTGSVREFIEGNLQTLNFPNRVRTLYKEHQGQYIWARKDRQQQLREAILTLDCLIQYGLTPEMYHRQQLTASKLALLEGTVQSRSPASIAEADVLLTDAVLTFMFQLRFGSHNPNVSRQAFDNGKVKGLAIDSVLRRALTRPEAFRETILSVQPKAKGYQLLQDYLRLLSSQYAGDSFEIPMDTLRLLALNLERYRWENSDYNHYLEINIPSFTLNYVNGSVREQFQVIVGMPGSPTPLLKSQLISFTTAPTRFVSDNVFRGQILPKAIADASYLARNNLKIFNSEGKPVSTDRNSLLALQKQPSGYFARRWSDCSHALGSVAFSLKDGLGGYLHDTSNDKLFSRKNRAISKGCIRVEKPEKLTRYLLNADRAPMSLKTRVDAAMAASATRRHFLGSPVPIVIRYITCEIQDGMLVRFPDVYGLDKQFFEEEQAKKKERGTTARTEEEVEGRPGQEEPGERKSLLLFPNR